MNNTRRYTLPAIVLGLALLIWAYFMGISTLVAKGTTLFFSPNNCYTAAATTTLAYMTPGTATTTATCSMGNDGASSAILAVELNASSTLTQYNLYPEESMDGQDWYPISMNQVASTTNPFSVTTAGYVNYVFASSTIGGVSPGVGNNLLGVDGTNNRNHFSVEIPVRMKRVRVWAALAPYPAFPYQSTTTPQRNAGLWMQIIPKIGI